MRMRLTVKMQTKAGNRAIEGGSMAKLIEATMDRIKPEAAYFHDQDGCRTATFYFDLKDPADIPSIAEPLFMGLEAEISMTPVMNADDLRKGLTDAMQAL